MTIPKPLMMPMTVGRRLRLVVGGPWYGSKVEARLAQALAQFSAQCLESGLAVVEDIIFEDGMLDLSRNRLLARAIASGVDWFVSVDADCSFRDQTATIIKSLDRHKRSEVAIVGAPVKQGNGRYNYLGLDELRPQSPELPSSPIQVGSVGFGFIAFRCGWYATHWPRQDRHFVPFFQTICYPDPRAKFGMGAWGEDFGHCKAVRDLGGLVMVDPSIRVPHHMVRPGHPAAKDE